MANTRNEGTSNRGFASMIQMNKEKLPVVVGAQPMPAAMRMSLRQKKHAVPAPEVI